MMEILPLPNCLISNFDVSHPNRRSNRVSLETKLNLSFISDSARELLKWSKIAVL